MKRVNGLVTVLVSLGGVLLSRQAGAATLFNDFGGTGVPANGTGVWHVAENWSLGIPQSRGGGDTEVSRVNGGRTVILSTAGVNNEGTRIGESTLGSALIQDGAELVTPYVVVGRVETTPGYGTIIQTGGRVTTGSVSIPSSQAGSTATGRWTQVAGTNTFNGGFTLSMGDSTGCSGTYKLEGGLLELRGATAPRIGSRGAGGLLHQTGGVLDAGNLLIQIGYDPGGPGRGRMIVDGGIVTNATLVVGRQNCPAATLEIRGGSLYARGTITGYSSVGTLANDYVIEQSGGLLRTVRSGTSSVPDNDGTVYLGYANSATHTYNQSGGTNVVGYRLQIGYGTGAVATYTMSGGMLSAYDLNVGVFPGDTTRFPTGTVHVVGMAPEITTRRNLNLGSGAAGTLRLTLGPDGGMRPITVTDTFNAGSGRLIVSADGFEPTPGGVVTIVTFVKRSGSFSSTTFTAAGVGDIESADVVYKTNSITLENIRLVRPKGTLIAIR